MLNKLVQKAKEFEETLNKEVEQQQRPHSSVDLRLREAVEPEVEEEEMSAPPLPMRTGAPNPEPEDKVKEPEDLKLKLAQTQREVEELRLKLNQRDNDIEALLTKQPSNRDDNKIFSLEEQIRELTIQLKSKQLEQESLLQFKVENERLITQHEEKMKKVKQLFAAAQKQSNEQKEVITQRDLKITELETSLADLRQRYEKVLDESRGLRDELKETNEKLEGLEASSKQKIEMAERQLERKTNELQTTVSEFQAYKTRAYSILNQTKATDLSTEKSTEFQETIHRLEMENGDLKRSNLELNTKLREMESIVKAAFDQSQTSEIKMMARKKEKEEAEELLKRLKSELESLKSEHIENLKHRDILLQSTVERVKEEFINENRDREAKLAEKEVEIASLQKISEGLSNELSVTRNEVFRLRDELSQVNSELALVRQSSKDAEPFMKKPQSTSPSVSIEELFQPSNDDQNRMLVREYELKMEQLQEMLDDSEATVQRLLDQEKILKEEVRRFDRMEKRKENVNIEYLKNIVIKFALHPSDSLIPVLSQVLHLDPGEVDNLKKELYKRQQTFWNIY